MSEISRSPRIVARNILIAIGLAALALLLWAGRDVIFILFFGVLVGIFLGAFTGWLEEHGVKRVLALVLVLVVLVGALTGFWVLLWPTVSDQLSTVGREIPQAVERVTGWVESQYQAISGQPVEETAELEDRLRDRVRTQMGAILSGALPIINSVIGALAGLLLVIVVGIYTAARPELYRNGFLRLFPPRHRDRMAETLDRAGTSLRKWMVGTAINMLLIALLTGVGLWLLDVPAAIALAVIAGIFEFVPIVGPIIAAIPAVAVALTVSPMTALWVVLLYTVVQQIEGNILTPLVMRGTVRLPPALTVLFQALMAAAFGFLGLLLAVPILAVVIVVTRTLYVEPLESRGGEAPGDARTAMASSAAG